MTTPFALPDPLHRPMAARQFRRTIETMQYMASDFGQDLESSLRRALEGAQSRYATAVAANRELARKELLDALVRFTNFVFSRQ